MKINNIIRLYMQMTNICNSRCRFCPYKDNIPKEFEIMSMEDMKKYLTTIKDYLTKNNITLQIFNPYNSNEPFTDPEFNKKMAAFFELFPFVYSEIYTNGSFLKPEISRELIEILNQNQSENPYQYKHCIIFNIQGVSPETLKFQTQRDDWSEVLNNFIELVKINENRVNIILKNEIDDKCGYVTYDILKFWEGLSIPIPLKRKISFQYYYPHDRAGVLKGDLNLGTEMKSLVGCKFSPLRESIYLIQNGDIVTCCNDWNNVMTVGNLKKQTFEEVINSDLYWETFLKIYGIIPSPDNFICKSCYFAKGLGNKTQMKEGRTMFYAGK